MLVHGIQSGEIMKVYKVLEDIPRVRCVEPPAAVA